LMSPPGNVSAPARCGSRRMVAGRGAETTHKAAGLARPSQHCRPREGRDPYRGIHRSPTVGITNHQASPKYSLGVWVPALARTTLGRWCTLCLNRLVIASAAKQSRLSRRRDSGLLRCARNDGVRARASLFQLAAWRIAARVVATTLRDVTMPGRDWPEGIR